MKILVISDIHANLPALQQLESYAKQADRILCLGDTVGYNAFPNECIDWLQDHDAECVKGNHDQAALDEKTEWFHDAAALAIGWTRKELTKKSRKFLQDLPLQIRMEHEGVNLLAVHGSPRDPLHEYVFPDDLVDVPDSVDILAVGHTHLPFIRKQTSENGRKNTSKKTGQKSAASTKPSQNAPASGKTITIFNPGSVGQPRDGDARASFAWLKLPEMKINLQRMKYPVEETARANQDAGLPDSLSERLFAGR